MRNLFYDVPKTLVKCWNKSNTTLHCLVDLVFFTFIKGVIHILYVIGTILRIDLLKT